MRRKEAAGHASSSNHVAGRYRDSALTAPTATIDEIVKFAPSRSRAQTNNRPQSRYLRMNYADDVREMANVSHRATSASSTVRLRKLRNAMQVDMNSSIYLDAEQFECERNLLSRIIFACKTILIVANLF